MSRSSRKSEPLTTLEEAVMLTMQTQPRYGLEISDIVYSASHGGQDMNIGTLYPLLKRLTQRGLLTHVSKSEDTTMRRGHQRKYYQLTSLGKKALVNAEQLRQNLRSLDERDYPDGLQPSPIG